MAWFWFVAMKQLLLCARVLELRKYNGPAISRRAKLYRSAEQKGE